jgi:hypothetical protein
MIRDLRDAKIRGCMSSFCIVRYRNRRYLRFLQYRYRADVKLYDQDTSTLVYVQI